MDWEINFFTKNIVMYDWSDTQTYTALQVDLHFFNIVLLLVSKHKSEGRYSLSRIEAWDLNEEILNLVSKLDIDGKNLVLVSKHETQRQTFSISSRSMRLK